MSTLKSTADLDAFLAHPRGVLFIDVVPSVPAGRSREAIVAFHKAWTVAEPGAGVVFARVDATEPDAEASVELIARLKAWFNGAGFPGPELVLGGNGPVAWSRGGVMAGVVLSAHRAGQDELMQRTRDAFGL